MPRTDPALKRADDAARYAATLSDPEKLAARRASDNARYRRDILKRRFQANSSHDRRMGRETATWEEVADLFAAPCHYCGGEGGGVDRIDSSKGHTRDNVVPACFRCNFILSDLPFSAKSILSPALANVEATGAWASWTPPILRNRKVI